MTTICIYCDEEMDDDVPHKCDKVSSSSSNALLYEVEAATMKRIYFALETARDNAIECYNDHMAKLGQGNMTKCNEYVADCLKKDIEEAESLITELSSKWSFGV